MGALRAGALFAGRSLRHAARDVESLLVAIMLPALVTVMFTVVFSGIVDVGGDYLSYVAAGVVLLCAGFGAASAAVGVARDLEAGFLDRLRTLPIASATVLAGHTIASLLRNLLATAVVLGVAMALGYRPSASLGGWAAAVGLIGLWILAITSVYVLVGLLTSSPNAASGYGFALLFLPYVSSAFAPVDSLPGWLQPFARHQPLTPLIESLRSLLSGGAAPDASRAVAWASRRWPPSRSPSASHGARPVLGKTYPIGRPSPATALSRRFNRARTPHPTNSPISAKTP